MPYKVRNRKRELLETCEEHAGNMEFSITYNIYRGRKYVTSGTAPSAHEKTVSSSNQHQISWEQKENL